MRSAPNALRLAILITACAAAMATSQVQPGDRAGDGTCPIGEICAEEIDGLFFAGTPTGDESLFGSEWPKATAVGGTQTLRMYLDIEATLPLDLPFDATIDSALSIRSADDTSITVAGEATGTGQLRVVRPDSTELYDRITLEARAIDRVELVPSGRYLWFDPNYSLDFDGDDEIAILAGGEARLTVAFYAADSNRVMDEGLQFSTTPGVRPDSLGFIDTVRIAPLAAGAIDLSVRAAGQTHTLPIRSVESADEILSLDDPGVLVVEDGSRDQFCFRAQEQGAIVLGASWTFRVGSSATLELAEDADANHCIQVIGLSPGRELLTVTAANASADFAVQVVAPRSARYSSPTPTLHRFEPGVAGERAESMTLTYGNVGAP